MVMAAAVQAAQAATSARSARGRPHLRRACSLRAAPRGQAAGPAPASAAAAAPLTWRALGLPAGLAARLAELGAATPSPVQAATTPVLVSGRSAAVKSYTGSGKTLAYLVPLVAAALQQMAEHGASADGAPYAVVVAPSRELAMQIVRQAQALLGRRQGDDGSRMVQQAIGGASMPRQCAALRENRPLIVVGTPGRLADLSREGSLRTHGASALVLDEADDLAAPAFEQPMSRLLEHVGRRAPSGKRQLVLVSATLAPRTLRAAAEAGHPDIEMVAPGEGDGAEQGSRAAAASKMGLASSLPPNLSHAYLVAPRRHAYDALRRSLRASGAERAAVFLNHPRRIPDAAQRLQAASMDAVSLHGGMDKIERGNALQRFRRGDANVIVLNECGAVFNLELPSDARHYVHRAGRAGRMGREGLVLSIVDPSEAFVIDKFSRELGGDVHFSEVILREGKLVEVTPEMKAETLRLRDERRAARGVGDGDEGWDDAPRAGGRGRGRSGGWRAEDGRGGRGRGRSRSSWDDDERQRQQPWRDEAAEWADEEAFRPRRPQRYAGEEDWEKPASRRGGYQGRGGGGRGRGRGRGRSSAGGGRGRGRGRRD